MSVPFSGVKLQERESEHPPVFREELQNGLNFASVPPYVFMQWFVEAIIM
jgi:hypothetical protein